MSQPSFSKSSAIVTELDHVFTDSAVSAFADRSRDHNPLHVDPGYAKRSSFGGCIVHGVMAMLAALENVNLGGPVRLQDVSVQFKNPIFGGRNYTYRIIEGSGGGCSIALHDGSAILMQLTLTWEAPSFVEEEAAADEGRASSHATREPRVEACEHEDEALLEGVKLSGTYSTESLEELYPAACSTFGKASIEVLALSSFLVGMKLPGKRALFSSMKLTFHGHATKGHDLAYQYETQFYNQEYGLLETQLTVRSGEGAAIARGQLKSFVRKDLAERPISDYLAKVGEKQRNILSGSVALVTGAGRGLGASLAKSLAVLGCHVYLNYLNSEDQARAMARDLEASGLEVSLCRGDASDSEWCERLKADLVAKHGKLDLLVCNACEPPLRMEDEPNTLARREEYVARNLKLVRAPISAFSELLERSSGACVAISSEMVDSKPKGFSHYVDLKQRVEAAVSKLAEERPAIRGLIARPANLLTEMSNTPTRILNAMSPDDVAMQIVNGMVTATEGTSILSAFGTAKSRPRSTIMLTGSFTLDLMVDAFKAWLPLALDGYAVQQTGYNQVMQDLLSPGSLLNTDEGTVNVIFLRIADWLHERKECWGAAGLCVSKDETFLRQLAREFTVALREFCQRSRAWQLLVVCPEPALDPRDAAAAAILGEIRGQLLALDKDVSNVTTVVAHEHYSDYDTGLRPFRDESRDEIAHIPFTQSYYQFLALLSVRMVHAKKQRPYKVIVLDCDNTLWKGVCGEVEDVNELIIDQEFTEFQRSFKELLKKGFIVCLCSKNREDDVWKVFEQHHGMLLTREDVAAVKINWQPKSENIRALAQELNLGLNSFIFFDDNPVECAEVRAACPEVLTICLTQTSVPMSRWGRLLWAFDQVTQTREDGSRTKMYREQSQREQFKKSAESFRGFIDGLDLQVVFSPPSDDSLDRVAQMTLRTNQFNNTTIRRDKSDVVALLKRGEHHFLLVRVTDRFGDYGTTGLVTYQLEENALFVESFLLSCRVLGRTVEDKILQKLMTIAEETRREQLHIAFVPTKKNTPFQQFLDKLGPARVLSDGRAQRGMSRYVYEIESLRAALDKQAYLEQEAPEKKAPKAPFSWPADDAQGGVDYIRIAEQSRAAFEVVEASSQGEPSSRGAEVRTSGPIGRTMDLERTIKVLFAQALSISPEAISEYEELEKYGLESMDVVNITVELTKLVPELSSSFLFEHRTLHSMIQSLRREYGVAAPWGSPVRARSSEDRPVGVPPSTTPPSSEAVAPANEREDIAIIGLHGNYPGAEDMPGLWRLLQAGGCELGPMPASRRQLMDRSFSGISSSLRGFTERAGYIENIDRFDAEMFGITPREAELMDPQQRLFLQVVWGLLEDAGYTKQTVDRSTGVFVGVLSNDYAMYANLHALQHAEQYRHTDYYQIANRVSYCFDLQGPSMAIDTACASSGTAFHLACQAIRAGNCGAAIVGGVNLILHPSRLIQYSQTGMLSASGRCQPFGQGADGTLLGEGVGAVLLKPLSQARRDGDNIYAVIKSSWVNSGGKTNGFTVPNPNAQAKLIEQALEQADVPVDSIAYVEAHGTGTSLGDPIEVSALSRAFRRLGGRGSRRIGSIKANIGHTESNAFLAGLSKVLLQFKHRQWVPTLTSEDANKAIDFASAGFEVQRTLRDWDAPPEGTAASSVAACISNFGAGGSNVHVVLQEFHRDEAGKGGGGGIDRYLVPLSANKREGLALMCQRLRDHLESSDPAAIDLASVAYTLQVGRPHLDHRVIFIVSDLETLRNALSEFSSGVGESALWLSGNTAVRNALGNYLDQQDDMQDLLKKWVRDQDCERIAQLWLHGFNMPWAELYAKGAPSKVSLPTYPFQGPSYWLEHSYHGPSSDVRAQLDEPADEAPTFFEPVWVRRDVSKSASTLPPFAERHIVFLGIRDAQRARLEWELKNVDATYHILPHVEEGAFEEHALALFDDVKGLLRNGLRGNVLLQVTAVSADGQASWSALMGLLKTATQENPMLSCQLIELDAPTEAAAWLDVLQSEMHYGQESNVLYSPQRHVRSWQALPQLVQASRFRDARQSTRPRNYLITGGSGVLARACAKWIGSIDDRARVFLLARRAPASLAGAQHERDMDDLRNLGMHVEYHQVDLRDRQALDRCIEDLRAAHGPMNGVIHCAGIVRDAYLVHKSPQAFAEVLSPKVAGTLNVDWATREHPLDFFVLFSSISAVLGNAGQGDYATANAFMDAYAHRRKGMVERGTRSGHTVSINWPLWHEGGMSLDPELARLLEQQHGLRSISNEEGARMLGRILTSASSHVFVGTGRRAAIENTLNASEQLGRPLNKPPVAVAEKRDAAALYPYLKRTVSAVTKLDAAQIDEHEPLSELGLDSILITKLNSALAEDFPQLPRTLFYEYPTLAALAGYLIEQAPTQAIPAPVPPPRAPMPLNATPDRSREFAEAPPRRALEHGSQPIAIIGMAGRYPNAPSLEDFWQRLQDGSSQIDGIPSQRWYGEKAPEPGLRGKRGAFLESFAQFDPVFFQMAPVDAYGIDPQERLVLMTCWHALESSGYTRQRLEEQHGQRVAVCVGATKSGFNYLSAGGAECAGQVTSASFSSMANRVSYFLDVKGPSISFDTMCTSSITAIHHACQYLQHGECDLAIAAAVNLYLHPNDYLVLQQLGMLSGQSQVQCFAAEGTGFIPGEGVGAVILKRLDAALADGDRIEGIISATALSHSGRTHGYTAPSLAQQEQLVRDVIERSGHRVEDISYIESAANGSSMGDAIEWGALKNVFRARRQPCRVGSIKPNIGHLEAAAGISQLSKVVLQMKHRTLVPTLSDEGRLDHGLMRDSGLQLVTERQSWENADGPQRCLITAAGAGGTYAAMVVEQPLNETVGRTADDVPVAIVLSARTADALKRMAGNLHDHLAARPELGLADIAYTLQVGREAMKVRVGFVAASRHELMQSLRAMMSTPSASLPGVFATASIRDHAGLASDVRSWVDGGSVDWLNGYRSRGGNERPRMLALPGYSFDSAEYWRRPAAPETKVLVDKSVNGKSLNGKSVNGVSHTPPVAVIAQVKEALKELLQFQKVEDIDDRATFFELGIDSIRMVGFVRGMSDKLGLSLEETVLFDHPTVMQFSQYAHERTSARSAAAPEIAPRVKDTTEIVSRVKDTVKALLHYPASEVLDDQVTFFELGIDSIRMVNFVQQLSEKLALNLEETVLFDHPSVAGLARYLADRLGADVPKTESHVSELPVPEPKTNHAQLQENLRRCGRTYEEIVPLQCEGEGPILFCLHPASGDVAMFSKLVTAVGDRCRIIGIKAKGFLTKKNLCDSAEEMAAYYAEIIQAVDPVGPYHLMGASMGGVVAYAAARVLQQAGKPVQSIFMLETPLITQEKHENIFALDEVQNWLTNANFLMIAMLHLDPAFRQRKKAGQVKWSDLVITAHELSMPDGEIRPEVLEERLLECIVQRGVRQSPDILRLRLRSMAETHRNNLRCMREYRWQPLPRPHEADILMFRTESAKATSDEVYNPNYLHRMQRELGSMIPLLDTWVDKMPHVKTVVVGGRDHFDLCNHRIGTDEILVPMLATMNRDVRRPGPPRPGPSGTGSETRTRAQAAETPAEKPLEGRFQVAIIGMSARFPGAETVDQFWNELLAGSSLIQAYPAGRFAASGAIALRDGAPTHGCLFERIDGFDCAFFHISPNEAQLMDPSERLFLQEAWRAVEDAGLVPDKLAGSNWGVFAGSGGDYNLHVQPILGIAPQVSQSTFPGRVAYQMNLNGPTVAVDAGCASSLMAVKQACDSLKLGQCKIAIAGGAMVYSTPNLISASHYYRLLSEENRVQGLGAGAKGMLPGEAVAVVVLKPLDEAVRDGDRIYSVIEAWGSNHNGRTQGIAAPSAAAQAELLSSVYRQFGIDSDSIDFIEANASGSPLGDKVELQGLKKVFEQRPEGSIVLGTVENNVGHSFAASGMTHLLKGVLSLYHEAIPSTLNVDANNSALGKDAGPFYINTTTQPWPRRSASRRRAGVSSYSATGINVHLVVSESPSAEVPEAEAMPHGLTLMAISGHTPEALHQRCRDLLGYITASTESRLGMRRLSANLLLRRHHLRYRYAVLARDKAHFVELLEAILAQRTDPNVVSNLVPGAEASHRSRLQREVQQFGAGADWKNAPFEQAAQWFAHGIEFDARNFFRPEDRAPLSLPGYPFADTRCWLLPETEPVADAVASSVGLQGEWLLHEVAKITGNRVDELRLDAGWNTMGFDSLMSVRFLSAINERTGADVQLVDLLDKQTPGELLDLLHERSALPRSKPSLEEVAAQPMPPVQYPWFERRLSGLPSTIGVTSVGLQSKSSHSSVSNSDHIVSDLLARGIAVFRDIDKAVLLAPRTVDIDQGLSAHLEEALNASFHALPPGRLWAPLSQEQERNLYVTEEMDSTAWNVFHIFRLHSHDIDFVRLQHALTQLARQQDLLRTRYCKFGDVYAQCVSELVCVSLDYISMGSSQAFYQFIQGQRSHQLLDAGRGTPIKMWLTETEGSFYLGLVAHHAHADAFTSGLLFSQLMDRYQELGRAGDAVPTESRRDAVPQGSETEMEQYWLYALQQYDASVFGAKEHEDYWRDKLRGLNVAMQLPYRGQAGTAPPSRKLAANHIIPVSQSLGGRIADLSRQHGISYTQLFAAVLAVVLQEFCGNRTPVLQVIHNHRDRASLAACLGDFANVSFMPFQLKERQSVVEFLYDVRKTLLQSLQHSKVRFNGLLELAGLDGYPEYCNMVGDVVLDSADIDTANVDVAGEYGVSAYMDAVLEQRRIHFLDQSLASIFFQFLKVDEHLYIFHSYNHAAFEHGTMQKLLLLVVDFAEAMLRDLNRPMTELVAEFQRQASAMGDEARTLAKAGATKTPEAHGEPSSAVDLLKRLNGGDISVAQLQTYM